MSIKFLNPIAFITPILLSLAALSASFLFILHLLIISLPISNIKINLKLIKSHKSVVISLIGFLSLCLFSTFYSLNPVNSLAQSFKLSVILIFGFYLLLSMLDIKTLDSRLFLNGYYIALVFCTIEYLFNGVATKFISYYILHKNIYFDPTHLNRGMAFLAIAIWVAFAILLKNGQRVRAYNLLIFTTLIIFTYTSESAKLGLVIGMVTYILAIIFTDKFAKIFQIGLVSVYILIPIILYNLIYNPHLQIIVKYLPWSFEHRLYIWQNVLDLISLEPLTGFGANASRIISGLDLSSLSINSHSISLLPIHPHNAVLQILLELGTFGLILYLSFWLSIISSIAASNSIDKETKPFIYTIIATYLAISQSSFDIWISWWLCQIFIIIFYLIACNKSENLNPNIKEQRDMVLGIE